MGIVDPTVPMDSATSGLAEKNHCTVPGSPASHRLTAPTNLGGLLKRRNGSFTRAPRPDKLRRGSLGGEEALPVTVDDT